MKILLFLLAFIPGMALATGPELITLTAENTISLRDSVNWSSISQLQYQLLQKAARLDDDEPIYLVLDTPGGSVSAGEMFIETLKGVKQPVHTIVIFAASMGFQITQSTDFRHILSSGTLMSHRATVGINGQIDGELESRLSYYKKAVGEMEVRSAKRVGMSIVDYKAKILNEWWEVGKNAVTNKMADSVVAVKCSDDLVKRVVSRRIKSLFGSRLVMFSACPLITTPIAKAKRSHNNKLNNTNNAQMDLYMDRLFFNKRSFLNNYINTGMFNQ
jgi:ATP-dependent Clp protease protease subunit